MVAMQYLFSFFSFLLLNSFQDCSASQGRSWHEHRGSIPTSLFKKKKKKLFIWLYQVFSFGTLNLLVAGIRDLSCHLWDLVPCESESVSRSVLSDPL